MIPLRIALAQTNMTVGDLDGNTQKILSYMQQAHAAGAHLVCFPELALTGYPPEDLLLKPGFITANLRKLDEIVQASQDMPGTTAIVGFVDRDHDIYNAAAVIYEGKLVGVYHKHYLPNYGVFDEYRYFSAGTTAPIFLLHDIHIGINICEDIWYPTGPLTQQAQAGAEVIININGSPFYQGRGVVREEMISTRAADNGVIIAYLNLVGGQDELVFDGGSTVFNEQGLLIARGKQFSEDLLMVDVDTASVFRSRLHDPRRRQERWRTTNQNVPEIIIDPRPLKIPDEHPALLAAPQRIEAKMPPLQEIYSALVLGTRDYVHKTGFKQVIIGLSGGIDSTLVAVIAADALGAENVFGISMPSGYSSDHSKSDAQLLADNLGIRYQTIAIEETFRTSLHMMEPILGAEDPGLAAENLQARIRGNILMTVSNRFGPLVLTTGNKSEMAVGYSTLYGDMAGGYAVLKDVLKTLVFALCRYRNTLGDKPVIPQTVIDKPPSAELRPDQKDVDSLPPYEELDPILEAYVEDDRSFEEMLAMGYQKATIERVLRLVDQSEYKRRQAPPGIKITPRAFGRDRRLPITNRYREGK
ncbi:NAD+ synthase [Dictyobacter arantiisoli]|uniref:NAD+ synthase n=1 Tax=Dictyobacter arantiisoli TaxID=2014874 RepID=UPI0011EFF05E